MANPYRPPQNPSSGSGGVSQSAGGHGTSQAPGSAPGGEGPTAPGGQGSDGPGPATPGTPHPAPRPDQQWPAPVQGQQGPTTPPGPSTPGQPSSGQPGPTPPGPAQPGRPNQPGQPGFRQYPGPGRQYPNGPNGKPQGPVRPTGPLHKPTKEEAVKARNLLVTFACWVIGALVLAAFPFPYQVIALVPAVCGVVWGARVITYLRRIGIIGGALVTVVIGIAVSGYMVLQSGALLITWNTQAAYAECTVGAVTIAGQSECDAQYRQSLENFLKIAPQSTPSPTPTHSTTPSPSPSPTPPATPSPSAPTPTTLSVSSIGSASSAP